MKRTAPEAVGTPAQKWRMETDWVPTAFAQNTVPAINDTPQDIIERILAHLCEDHAGGGAALTLVNKHVNAASQRYLESVGDFRFTGGLQRINSACEVAAPSGGRTHHHPPHIARNPRIWPIWREKFAQRLEKVGGSFAPLEIERLGRLIVCLKFARFDPLFWRECFDTLLAHVRGLQLPKASKDALLEALAFQVGLSPFKMQAVALRRLRDEGRTTWPGEQLRAKTQYWLTCLPEEKHRDLIRGMDLSVFERSQDKDVMRALDARARQTTHPVRALELRAAIHRAAAGLDDNAVLNETAGALDAAARKVKGKAEKLSLDAIRQLLCRAAPLIPEPRRTEIFQRACSEIGRPKCTLRIELLDSCGTAMESVKPLPAAWGKAFATAANSLLETAHLHRMVPESLAAQVHNIPCDARLGFALKVLAVLDRGADIDAGDKWRAFRHLCGAVEHLERADERKKLVLALAARIPQSGTHEPADAKQLYEVFAAQICHLRPEDRLNFLDTFVAGGSHLAPLALQTAVAPFVGWLRPQDRGWWFAKHVFGALQDGQEGPTVTLDAKKGQAWLLLVAQATSALSELPRSDEDAKIVAELHRVLEPMFEILAVEGLSDPPPPQGDKEARFKRNQMVNVYCVQLHLARCLHLLPQEDQGRRCAAILDSAQAALRMAPVPAQLPKWVAIGACAMTRREDRALAAGRLIALMCSGEGAGRFVDKDSLRALSELMLTLAPDDVAPLVPRLVELEALVRGRAQPKNES